MLLPGDPVFDGIIVMVFEVFIICAISIYLTQVIPQTYGPVRPWYYPFEWINMKLISLKKSETVIQLSPQKVMSRNEDELKNEDADVKAERERIKSGNYDHDCPLVLNGMRKTYGSKLAVKDATFAVDRGVVFGLLGPNGAGKTSLISILTGVYNATSGQAFLGGYDSAIQPTQAFQSIGVCPQVTLIWT